MEGWMDGYSEERKRSRKKRSCVFTGLSLERKREESGGGGQGVCLPMLICPERVMGGQRRSGEGCWDVFKCARVLSNVNLS